MFFQKLYALPRHSLRLKDFVSNIPFSFDYTTMSMIICLIATSAGGIFNTFVWNMLQILMALYTYQVDRGQ